jgi:hypothetical protein
MHGTSPVLEPPVEAPVEPPVEPSVEPPVLEPPVLEPPVLEPPVLEPPVLEPPVLEPPVSSVVEVLRSVVDGDEVLVWVGSPVELLEVVGSVVVVGSTPVVGMVVTGVVVCSPVVPELLLVSVVAGVTSVVQARTRCEEKVRARIWRKLRFIVTRLEHFRWALATARMADDA